MLRVNVSVLLYVPVRSGSLARIACLNVIGTDSLEVGAVHVFSVPRPWSGCVSANVPLTSLPVLVGAGVGDAERRVTGGRDDGGAWSVAVYSCATPGVNAPNCAGAPSVRASVAGTLPPTVPGVSVRPSTCDLAAETLPL